MEAGRKLRDLGRYVDHIVEPTARRVICGRLAARLAPMIKQTLEISREPVHLSARLQQLRLQRDGELLRSYPCEDLGTVVVDHPQVTYTHGSLVAMLEAGAALVICGARHLPTGVLLPLGDHTEVVWRVRDQADAPKPVLKQLWKQLVRGKILAQMQNLSPESVAYRKLRQFALEVRSGDTTCREAQAAKVYWNAWLLQADETPLAAVVEFRRDHDGTGLNALLNYGYAIVRAALGRAIVSAGLHPTLGLHHSHRSNAFALADDLIEPLRPMVDRLARQLFWDGHTELEQPTKAELLKLLENDVAYAGETGPLFVQLHRYVNGLVKCYQGTTRKLEIPVTCKSVDIAECGS